MQLHDKNQEELIKAPRIKPKYHRKADKVKHNKQAEQVALAAYAATMVSKGKWREVSIETHRKCREAAPVKVHPDRHNNLFIKNFGVSTEEHRLGTRLDDKNKRLPGSQSQKSKHYG